MRIGILSDTHGRLHPAVYHHFVDVQHILHAGDVENDEILDVLEELAPVTAVSGNVDGSPTKRRPLSWVGALGGLSICMTHGHLVRGDMNQGLLEMFRAQGPGLIVHGHTHVARFDSVGGLYILNPGAACPPRFGARAGASICILEVPPPGRNEPIFPKFIELPYPH